MSYRFITKSIHAYLIDYPVARFDTPRTNRPLSSKPNSASTADISA